MSDDSTSATEVPTDPKAATVAAPSSGSVAIAARAGSQADDIPSFVEVSASHYRFDREVARGGMGRIRTARDRRLGRWVAVKEVLAQDVGIVHRFEREARITARLQHPSIVSVYEAGVFPDGQPFYAMPLVKGRSLADVIAERKTLATRLALVPNVLAVADAIAYAHGERVIHRDLKPTNVLVGEFGETVVIDWGIAKSLDDPNDRPSADPVPVMAMETIAGAVIGTPAYMPPEQANGENVDERADVYALGAMLWHVLAGVAPYTGPTAEVLTAVRAGPPELVTAREPDAPPDLVAIVERAMARDPSARYPSARELAEDLRRFQTGQLVGAHRYSLRQLLRRWVRRHRTALAVAVVASGLMMALGVLAVYRIMSERTRADELRALAEANRGDADDLTQFMLVDIHDKLAGIGRLDLLDGVARKAAGYYAKGDAGASDKELALHADALANIGDVLATRNDLVGGRAQYAAALDLRVRLLVRTGRREFGRAVATSYRGLGALSLRQHNAAQAKLELERSLELGDRLLAIDPNDEQLRHDKAVTLGLLGDSVVNVADSAEKHRRLNEAIAILEQLVARHPQNGAWAMDLAEDYKQLARLQHTEGDVAAGVEGTKKVLAITDQVAKLEPSNMKLLERLAIAHSLYADELQFAGDPQRALAEVRAGKIIFEQLYARDPTNTTYESDLGSSHRAIASALAQNGHYEKALDELQASLPLVDDVLARDLTNQAARWSALAARQLTGQILTADDRPLAAILVLRDAIAICNRGLALAPGDRSLRREGALLHNELGDALRDSGGATLAMAEHRTAIEISEKLLAEDPTSTWSRMDLAMGHRELGAALREQGKDDEALAELRAGLATTEEQAAKDKGNLEVGQRVQGFHERIGDIYESRAHKPGAGRRDAATAAAKEYEIALDWAQRLVAASPGRKHLHKDIERLTKQIAATRKLASGR
jgi:tetratricopeptide (TPR) repeat protein